MVVVVVMISDTGMVGSVNVVPACRARGSSEGINRVTPACPIHPYARHSPRRLRCYVANPPRATSFSACQYASYPHDVLREPRLPS
jgi:hypothetical protein